ncbi:MAG: hypothetical protein ABIR30_10355 [Chitinophagaceae bacterium]
MAFCTPALFMRAPFTTCPLKIVGPNSFKRLMYSMLSAIRRLSGILLLSFIVTTLEAQPVESARTDPKPYKILSSGKQITIKATRNIKQVMLWTTNGNRLIEQREINNSIYTFTLPLNHKAYYLMIGLHDGKIFTEKIGIP